MRKYFYIPLLLCFTFFFSSCESEDNYHSFITIVNKSDNDVYLCNRFTNVGKCNLSKGGTLKKKSNLEYNPYNGNIEMNLKNNGILEFYLVDPNHYNEPNVFYNCDSIALKNNILMHYKLTLEDLERMNWEIVYNGN